MNLLHNYDAMLKRFLKRKVRVTDALVVAFMITGAVGFAAPEIIIPEVNKTEVLTNVENLKEKITAADLENLNFVDVPEFSFDNVNQTLSNSQNSLAKEFIDADITIGPFKEGAIVVNPNVSLEYNGEITGEGFGLLADGFDVINDNKRRASIINEGWVSNNGDLGMVALDGGKITNNGVVKNEGNFGMLADGNDKVDEEFMHALAINNGEIYNKGDVGMGAFNAGKATNEIEGKIMNDGNFGMLADGVGKFFGNTQAEATNLGYIGVNEDGTGVIDFGMAAVNGGIAKNGSDITLFGDTPLATIANKGDFGMVAVGHSSKNPVTGFEDILSGDVKRSEAINHGIIENGGDFGLVALEGAIARNYGTVANKGDFGIVAANGVNRLVNNPTEGKIYYRESYAENDRGIVANLGDYGMAAIDGGYVQNRGDEDEDEEKHYGIIKNEGNFGMVAIGGADDAINDNDFIDNDPSNTIRINYFQPSIAENDDYGVIINRGDFGMAAIDGGFALNRGYIGTDEENLGVQNFGMVAIGGRNSEISISNSKFPLIPDLYSLEDDTLGALQYYHPSIALNNGGYIENDGDFGMAAIDGAIAINLGSGGLLPLDSNLPEDLQGVIRNNGDFGMAAIGKVEDATYGLYLPEGSDLLPSGHPEVDTSYSGDLASMAINVGGLIQNNGDFGMAALDGAYAINALGGLINNTGDVGMLLTGDSVGMNILGTIAPQGDIGVLMTGDSTLINAGFIRTHTPESADPGLYQPVQEDGIGVLAGAGNNTMYLAGNIHGTVDGGDGTNTLMYIPGMANTLNGMGQLDQYGTIVNNTFSHLGSFGPGSLTVDRDLELRMSQNTDKTNYNKDADGKIRFDQFNGFEYTSLTGVPIDGDITSHPGNVDIIKDALESLGDPEWRNDIYANADISQSLVGEVVGGFLGMGDINITEGNNLTLTLGQNRVSTIAANSITGDGTITQRTLDQFFVTDAKEIEVRNILVNPELNLNSLLEDVPSEGTINSNFDIAMDAENVADGWAVRYEQDAETGAIKTIYYRTEPVSNNSLLGGFRESVNEYTQSNVDVLNNAKIRDNGYVYARKFAFQEPKITTTSATVMKETTQMVTKGKEVVALPASTPEVINTTVATPYEWTQFAEIFGEAGKYDGDTNQHFDYSTFGATGGTFTRLNDRWTAGLTYGYAYSDVDFSKGSEDVNSLGANLFLTNRYNNWLGTITGGYSWSRHDLKRHAFDKDSLVDTGIIGENHLSADFDSHMWNAGIEIGYDWKISENSSLYPYAGFDYSWYTRNSYTEDGAGFLALDVDKTTYGIPMSKLGVQFEADMTSWVFTADLAWHHAFYDNEDEAKTYGNFKNLNSNSTWEIAGLDLGKDIGAARLALDFNATEQFTWGVEYNGYVRDGQFGNRGGLNFKYKW